MDESEFLSLLDRYKNPLFGFARRRLYKSDDAEDVLSDTILAAWEQRANFRPGTQFHAWIFTILLNKIYSANRRKRLEEKLPETIDARPPASEEQLSVEIAALAGNAIPMLDHCSDELRRAMDALNEHERETLLLFCLGELSYAEIAHAMNVPEGTVLTRLSRARAKLRLRLAELQPVRT
ncbi:MAG TPA: RNA polymerase sigma factor [Planctomycetota bacterium]|nr:RNA polymerase sigma factor [Planctomycetota bacterium]